MNKKIKNIIQLNSPGCRRESGFILLISLIILLVMMIASIGLMKSVEANNASSTNLALGQNSQLIADWGVERAFEWLNKNKSVLDDSSPDDGYFATSVGGSAVLNDKEWIGKASWDSAKVFDSTTNPSPPAGYTVRVLINRMCSATGAVNETGQSCSKGASSLSSGDGSELKIGSDTYGVGASGSNGGSVGGGSNYIVPGNVYYRVTVRVEGPKNTLSIIQSMITISPA